MFIEGMYTSVFASFMSLSTNDALYTLLLTIFT